MRRPGGLGLASLALLVGCSPITTAVDITILLPDDTSDLERTNNASLTLEPDGIVQTFATDGLDFALSLELDPDQSAHELALFLARDEGLLAWGRTPAFTFVGANPGLAVLVARPGGLSAMSTSFDAPDPDALAAPIADQGVVVLGGDGITSVIDAYAYAEVVAESLPDPPAAGDGVLVSDPAGGVQRLSAADGLRVARLDPTTGAWADRDLGEAAIAARPDAAWIDDVARARVLIVGGGDALDVVAVDVDPSVDAPVARPDGLTLDRTRPGATAATTADTESDAIVVFGGDDPMVPVAWWVQGQTAVGPAAVWTEAGCVVLATGPSPRWLCGGGLRDGAPTGDLVELSVSAAGEATATEWPGQLPTPVADPRWLADDFAVYAQGDGRMWRVDRTDLAVTEVAAASSRATGGDLTRLPTGFSLLVGGRDTDGTALTRWHVFAPDPVGDAP